MPEWIHDRAEHILAKNPSMPKGEAFAFATQQSHAVGKSPKGYGTAEGRHEAKVKYDTPHDDKKTANPGDLSSAKLAALFDEAVKLGAVSDEQAQKALERYESLERSKLTAGQVGRYGAIGALATPLISAGADAIAGKPILGGGGFKSVARGALGRAFAGGVGSAAIPILRARSDRAAEMGTLHQYLTEHGVNPTHHGAPTGGKLSEPFEPVEKAAAGRNTFYDYADNRKKRGGKEKDSGMSGATPARSFDANAYTVDLVKGAFATSAYSANIGYPTSPQKSQMPGFRMPSLRGAVQQVPQSIKVGFKLQGEMDHQGLDIAIENRKGSVRKGVDKDGKPWRTVMRHPYGYIRGTKGADGEEVDAYVGPKKDATHAYVVHQRKEDGKTYDEDKVMLGFTSLDAAREAYLKHYNDPKFLGPIKSVPMERFKALMESGKKLTKISEAPNLIDAFNRAFDRYYEEAGKKIAAGAPTRGGFLMSSEMPGFRAPSLKSAIQTPPQSIVTKFAAAVEKLGSSATTPAGMLAKSKAVGLPKVTAPPGPSIAQVAKPVGFGTPKPGALKNSI